MNALAIVHAVGERLGACELTFLPRRTIDLSLARAQHRGYCAALRAAGVDVQVVETSPDHPDAVFVEDAAIVLDEIAVAAAMGVASRRAEVEALLPVVAAHRRVVRLAGAGTLEGGDVLRVGRTLFVGLSPRSDRLGLEALARAVQEVGYRVVGVPVHGCLHLKTACTAVADDALLVNRAWLETEPLAGMRLLDVDDREPFAANVVRLGQTVLGSASHPRTLDLLERLGHDVRAVALDELEKAEAGPTCLSLLVARAGSA